jgi:hypothetical protein
MEYYVFVEDGHKASLTLISWFERNIIQLNSSGIYITFDLVERGRCGAVLVVNDSETDEIVRTITEPAKIVSFIAEMQSCNEEKARAVTLSKSKIVRDGRRSGRDTDRAAISGSSTSQKQEFQIAEDVPGEMTKKEIDEKLAASLTKRKGRRIDTTGKQQPRETLTPAPEQYPTSSDFKDNVRTQSAPIAPTDERHSSITPISNDMTNKLSLLRLGSKVTGRSSDRDTADLTRKFLSNNVVIA